MRNTPPPATTVTTDHRMLFGVPEAATVLGIGRTNVYALIQSGKLRSVKIGGRRLVPRAALDEFVADLMETP